MIESVKNQQTITVRDLYPDMSDEELAVAEANLKQYVTVIIQIHDRLKAGGKDWPFRFVVIA